MRERQLTVDALRLRGESVLLVNRSGHAHVPDDVEVIGGDAGDPAFTMSATVNHDGVGGTAARLRLRSVPSTSGFVLRY